MSCVEYRQCLEIVFTSDVEEAWQEAVPESTHLVSQTFVDLLWCFSVESNIFLLAKSEQRPALLAFNQPVMVYIRISEREETERTVKDTVRTRRDITIKNR